MNDEVKLILTKLKIVSEEKENGAYICDKEHSKLLLSYIEQLENNRDKAIEVIDLITPELWNISNAMTYKLKDIKYILKGDSDD